MNEARLISALFVNKDSNYRMFDNVECFDEKRNALTFDFSTPVICHPPCRLFSRMKAFSTAQVNEKELAYFAVNCVRLCGGVLEHPFGSSLWNELRLPKGNQVDSYGGFTISVNQSWFGFKAEKKTLLYICGIDKCDMPDYTLNFNAVAYTVSTSKKRNAKKELSKNERSVTTVEFCKFLIDIARLSNIVK